jgi:hypothetical protein
MAITLNTKSYQQDATLSKDAVRYTGPDSDFQTIDALDLKRTAPKPTKDFAGVARSQLKLSRSVVTSSETGTKWPAIFDVQVSIPVGATEADVDNILADFAALFAAGGVAKSVVFAHDITH